MISFLRHGLTRQYASKVFLLSYQEARLKRNRTRRRQSYSCDLKFSTSIGTHNSSSIHPHYHLPLIPL